MSQAALLLAFAAMACLLAATSIEARDGVCAEPDGKAPGPGGLGVRKHAGPHEQCLVDDVCDQLEEKIGTIIDIKALEGCHRVVSGYEHFIKVSVLQPCIRRLKGECKPRFFLLEVWEHPRGKVELTKYKEMGQLEHV